MTLTKPGLIIVTGRPASGKTTFSRNLSQQIRQPLISRDELKEGYINTFRSSHDDMTATVAEDVYHAFFQTIDLLLSWNISLIAEAAFQHKLWHPRLTSLMDRADIRIIICDIPPRLAIERYTDRMKTTRDGINFMEIMKNY